MPHFVGMTAQDCGCEICRAVKELRELKWPLLASNCFRDGVSKRAQAYAEPEPSTKDARGCVKPYSP